MARGHRVGVEHLAVADGAGGRATWPKRSSVGAAPRRSDSSAARTPEVPMSRPTVVALPPRARPSRQGPAARAAAGPCASTGRVGIGAGRSRSASAGGWPDRQPAQPERSPGRRRPSGSPTRTAEQRAEQHERPERDGGLARRARRVRPAARSRPRRRAGSRRTRRRPGRPSRASPGTARARRPA